MAKVDKIVVHIPDTRGVVVSPYGIGNLKIGMGVYTYSRLPGQTNKGALGSGGTIGIPVGTLNVGLLPYGTCPGATTECQAICYASRPVAEQGVVRDMWWRNSITEDVPPIPPGATLVRIHISGDFTTTQYIENWIKQISARPEVTVWAYTRSWRVPHLLPALERLRALPNVQLFASMDPTCEEMPPAGWRRSWIFRRTHGGPFPKEHRLQFVGTSVENQVTSDGTPSFICPEESGRKKNCVECGYCFEGKKNDVTFLEH